MKRRQIRHIFILSQMLLDAMMIMVAFFLAHWLRQSVDWPNKAVNLGPFPDYVSMMLTQVATILAIFFFTRCFFGSSSRQIVPGISVAFFARRIS